MASVCFYFQIHQPFRLRRHNLFNPCQDYFDDEANRQLMQRIAHRCYLPTNALFYELIDRSNGAFRFAMSITGTALQQFQRYCPEVIDSFRLLIETGAVELLSETSHHSLSFLYSQTEFAAQIALHRKLIAETFDQQPKIFRNTELIYCNDLADQLAAHGFDAILCEGVDDLLQQRPPAFVFLPPKRSSPALLLRNYRLTDDIAFRFGDQNWIEWPLTADKFARWIDGVNGNGYVVNLFMDYETFGEHHWQQTGIFEFLRYLPRAVLGTHLNDFATPREVIERYPHSGTYDVPHTISWADRARNLSAWLGNAMQSNAMHELYRLEPRVHAAEDPAVLETWRRLQTSDHFYYMSTKAHSDAAVHDYFNAYDSPYDAYINFMNVLDHFEQRLPKTSDQAVASPVKS
jgi:alpha-amylase